MSILFFCIVFALTIFLQQWLHRHIQGLALALTGNPGCAVRFLFYSLLPGVLLHEASHYLVARLLMVRTSGLSIGIGATRKRQVSLGSVRIERTDPIRESLVGVAPFVLGLTAIWLIAGLGFGSWPDSGLSLLQMFQRVRDYANDWTTWLDLYLVFAVSTAMIPSESDREPWGPVVSVFGLGVVALLLLGWTPRVSPDFVVLARQVLDALTFALAVSVFVNGAVAAALWVLEQTVGRLRDKPVEYRARKR